MTKLMWDAVGTRFFETGVDRGVLYPVGSDGVPWNGLTALTENNTGGDASSFWVNDQKYLNIIAPEDFGATLEAFTYPDEFALCDGTAFSGNGLAFGLQPRSKFDLTYRTLIGNDIDSQNHGYKIHLIYNAYASPSEKANKSNDDSVAALGFSWDLTATAVNVPGASPTAHLVIDSTKTDPSILSFVEGYLYGAQGIAPRMLTPTQLVSLFGNWSLPGLSQTLNFLGVTVATSTFVTNMGTNPEFETAGVTTTMRSNLAFDPVGRHLTTTAGVIAWNQQWYGGTGGTGIPAFVNGTSSYRHAWLGTVNNSQSTEAIIKSGDSTGAVVRTNLASDPNAQAPSSPAAGKIGWATGRWFGGGTATGTYTRLTGQTDGPLPSLTSYMRKAWTVASPGASGDSGFNVSATGTGGYPVTPGQIYTASTYLRSSSAHGTAEMFLQWLDASGNSLSVTTGAIVGLVANTWSRRSVTGTAPASAAFMVIVSDVDGVEGWAVGDTLDGTGLLVELMPGLHEYFDGSTALINFDTLGPANAPGYVRKTWLTTPTTGGDIGFTHNPAAGTAVNPNGYPVTAGTTITLSDYLRNNSATCAMNATMQVFWHDSSGNYISTSSGSQILLPVNSGWVRCFITVVVPAGATTMGFKPTVNASTGNMPQPGDTLDGGGLLAEVSDTLHPWFSGSSGSDVNAWSGTANASTSTKTINSVLDRVNLATNPKGTAFMAIANGSLGFNNGRFPTDTPFSLLTGIVGPDGTGITTAVRATWATTTANGRGFAISGNPDSNSAAGLNQLPVSPGQSITTSVYLRASNATMPPILVSHFIDATGARILPDPTPAPAAQAAPTPNVWTRYSQTVTAPTGAAGMILAIELIGATVAIGDTLDATGLLIEVAGAMYDYFDGSTIQNLNDFTYVWTGTVDNSQSNMNHVNPAGVSGAGKIQSAQWALSGTKSLKILPNTSSNDTSGSIGGDTGAIRNGMVPGGCYTFIATCRLTAAQTGTLSANARRIAVLVREGTGSYVTYVSAQAPNAAGVTELRVTVQLPSDTSEAFVRLYNGASYGNGDVWWDNFAIVQVPDVAHPYVGPYFDGATAPFVYGEQAVSPAWTGTAQASTSRFNTLDGLPATAKAGDGYLVNDELWIQNAGVWTDFGELSAFAGIID